MNAGSTSVGSRLMATKVVQSAISFELISSSRKVAFAAPGRPTCSCCHREHQSRGDERLEDTVARLRFSGETAATSVGIPDILIGRPPASGARPAPCR